MPRTLDVEADVVIVGFGAAGACAALEAAAAGCDVIVLDRFGGGGATALSGGVRSRAAREPQGRWPPAVQPEPSAVLSYTDREGE